MAYSRPKGRPYYQRFKSPETPGPPLGAYLQSLKREDLKIDSAGFEKTATITDCSFVASYNWFEKIEPTILIPGKPPRWTPLTKPMKLCEDAGQYFRDPNAAQYPNHPMEPAVLATLQMAPTVCAGLDVVACGSTLGNLLRFVRDQNKSFRILVEIVQNTVFFIRRENSPRELIPNVRGYGHTFPETYTSWDIDVKGSTSHQRLIRYRFGGLTLLVRFEADGYVSEGLSPPISKSESQLAQVSTLDDLVESFSTAKVTPGSPASCSKVKIKTSGDVIDQSLIFDLKTRSARKKEEDTLGEELPRLWVAQTQKFIIAYHENGVFNDIEVRDVKDEILLWEENHSNELSTLAALLHEVIALVRSNPDGKLELRYTGHGDLEVRKQGVEAGDTFSPEVKLSWMREADNENGSTSNDNDDVGWVEADEDYTACTDACGYCGHCTY